ncbi:hypothetical protein ACWGMK_06005 [Agrobacterium deltaense]
MVTEQQIKRARDKFKEISGITIYTPDEGSLDDFEQSRYEGLVAALEAALSAAEPVARQYRAGSPEGETSWRMVDDEHYAGWEAMKKRFPDSVTLQYRDLYAAATSALSAQVQDAAKPDDELFWRLRVAYLRGAEWRDITGSMHLVDKASYDYADKITSPLPAAPAKQEG